MSPDSMELSIRPAVEKRKTIVLTAGLAAGIFGVLYPGACIGILGLTLLTITLYRVSRRQGDPLLFRLFITGLIARLFPIILLSLISLLKDRQGYLFGDSRMHLEVPRRALGIFYGFLYIDEKSTFNLHYGQYGYTILHWLYSSVYYLAGFSPFLGHLINASAGCLTGWIIYLITFKICNNRKAAAWAMGLTLFWPSNILWSVELLKEPMIQLYISLIIYLFVDLIVSRKWRNLLILAVICFPLKHLRVQTHVLMLGTVGLSLSLCLPRRAYTGFSILGFLSAAFVIISGPAKLDAYFKWVNAQVINTQVGFITTGGSYYVFVPSRYRNYLIQKEYTMTKSEAAVSYLKALSYYLGVPSPLKSRSLFKLPAAAQMIVWYLLLSLFFIPGTLYLLRYHYRASGIVLIYIFVFTTAFALVTGNEGAAFRQRDVITPFFFIPISLGMLNAWGWLAQKYERLLNPAGIRQPLPQSLFTGPQEKPDDPFSR